MKKVFAGLCLALVIAFTCFATAQTCESGLRSIMDICIPENPQRIVVLDEGTMTDLLALGIQPMAVHDWGNRDYAQYLNFDPADIESAGTPDGPNYEVMLNLDADLIVGRARDIQWLGDNALENLQAIAPVVLSDTPEEDHWQGHLLFLGEVFNKQNEAQTLINTFNTRLAEFRNAYAAKGENATIAIIRSRPDAFTVYANDYFITDLVKAAGLEFASGVTDVPSGQNISLEEIDILNGDYLFVMLRNDREAETFQNAKGGPLWQFLPAVQNEQAYQVNWSVWVAGWNAVGAQLVIDDLFYYLLDGASSPTPNPLSHVISEGYGPEFDVHRFSNQ